MRPKKCCGFFTFILIGLLSTIVYSTNVFANDRSSPSIGLSKETSGDSETQLFFQLPDGRVVISKPNGAPYCKKKGTCDFPIDCYGNEGAPKKMFQWKCKNEPGACVGVCYQTPITSPQDVIQKVLATVVSG